MQTNRKDKERTLTFRTSPQLRAALEKIAVKEDRALGRVVIRLLNKTLKLKEPRCES